MLGHSVVDLVSFVGATLKLAAVTIGLAVALRRWSSGGRSPKLAAAGFGAGILAVLLTAAGDLVAAASAWTFYTPYSATSSIEPSRINTVVTLEASASLAAVASVLLLTAALWSAWHHNRPDAARNADP